MDTDPFTGNGRKINICKLLAGSEGTLAFTTRMKLEPGACCLSGKQDSYVHIFQAFRML